MTKSHPRKNNEIGTNQIGGMMKRCASCDSIYPSSTSDCQSCGFSPAVVDGFPAYAPDLAYGGGGYEADLFAKLAPLEESNFWFRARNTLLMWALGKYGPSFHSFLEIGCGTGYVLSGVAKQFPHATLYGSEIFVDGLAFASTRVPSAELMQMDARKIPYFEEVDVIGAFDVLEHIEEDEQVLDEMRGALEPGGLLMISVPQHRWLWSPADDHAFHVRRYTKPELHTKIRAAGFEILRSTSFVSFLLPAMLLSRLKSSKGQGEYDATDELKLPKILNAVFYGIMRLELGLIKLGINFPVGGSRLVVARKIHQA